MNKIILLLMILINSVSFSKYSVENIHKDVDKLFTIVSDTHNVRIGNNIYDLDLKRLLLQTAMIESNLGRDKYNGRIAKTYMQIEEKTAKWYMSQVPELKSYIEEELGRKLVWNKDSDAVFVSYLIYMSKLQQHHSWLNKFRHTNHFKGDVEYYIYKIFYNSLKGASTLNRWNKREIEYYDLKYKS
ncbi:MAG: hypothetical protein ACRC1T_09375 [Clostridium chrysemydis]|uniref:hypothetical protein n=1 Tax=Clostridium chrysemydis TaxID=2665504 RepID=UPI003F3FBF5A